jgi:EamA domain-containing membrane protein RarD
LSLMPKRSSMFTYKAYFVWGSTPTWWHLLSRVAGRGEYRLWKVYLVCCQVCQASCTH